MKHPKPNTLANHVYSIVTDFIWLKASDIERMLYVDGYAFTTCGLKSAIKTLFCKGKIVRRELLNYRQESHQKSHQYMRTPK